MSAFTFNLRPESRIAGYVWIFGLLAIVSTANASPIDSRHKACTAPSRLHYQFPLGTWIENIAVRANGQLLVTLLSAPDLYLIDPLRADPRILVHSFPDALGLTGITEVTPDIFAVSSTNFSLSSLKITPNSSIAWTVDLRKVSLSPSSSASNLTTLIPPPTISKITSLSSIVLPNGQCLLSSTDSTILIGDVRTGTIYRLNTLTGVYSAVISTPQTAAVADPTFVIEGVNGIHIRDGILYFVNSGQGTFAKIPIHSNGTLAVGNANATIITRAAKDDYFDDFALRGDAAYLVTGSGNSVVRVGLDETGVGGQVLIAGGLNSTRLAEPTAAAFGRMEVDRDVLYVVTAGGLATPVEEGGKDVRIGGQVVAVDLGCCCS